MAKRKRSSYVFSSNKSAKRSGGAYRDYRRMALLRKGILRRTGLYGRFRGSGGYGRSIEMKWFDRQIQYSADSYVYGNVVNTFVTVSQGTGANEMLGNKIVIRKINVNMIVTKLQDSATLFNGLQNTLPFRIVVILDKQCNGTTCNWTDVFQSSNVYSQIKMENSKRFIILKDWRFTLTNEVFYDSTTLPYGCGAKTKYLNWTKKCFIPIEYAAQVGTSRNINELRSNNILIMCNTTPFQATSETSMVKIDGFTRIRYLDN